MNPPAKYLRSVGILKAMLSQGLITEGEFAALESDLASKNGLPEGSVFRPKTLIKPKERAMNSDDGKQAEEGNGT